MATKKTPPETRGRKPLPAGTRKLKPLSLRLPPDLARDLDDAVAEAQAAAEPGVEVTKTRLVIDLLRAWLATRGKRQGKQR